MWPVYRITTDVTVTVRIVSAFLMLQFLRMAWNDLRPGPAWPDRSRWRVFLAVSGLGLILTVSNVFIGSVGYLELLFFFAVGQPIGTFIRAVGDLHHNESEENSA